MELLIPATIIKPQKEVHYKKKRKRSESQNSPKNPKGLLAVIKSCVLNSKGEVPITLVDAKSAAKTVANDGNFGGDLIVIHDNNQVTPGYLPDLSDLAILPPGLKVALQWIVTNHGGEGGVGYEKVIPESISSLIGIDPAKPQLRTSIVTVGEHCIKFNSYNDYKNLFFTSNHCTLQQLTISSSLHTTSLLDGKTINISMTLGNTNFDKVDSNITRNKVLVWNCKSIAKDRFVKEFKATVELTMPDVVILIETRVSVHMGRVICNGVHPFAVYESSKSVEDGGHAIVVFKKENTLKVIDSFINSKTWLFVK